MIFNATGFICPQMETETQIQIQRRRMRQGLIQFSSSKVAGGASELEVHQCWRCIRAGEMHPTFPNASHTVLLDQRLHLQFMIRLE